jgi:hypothetical protein
MNFVYLLDRRWVNLVRNDRKTGYLDPNESAKCNKECAMTKIRKFIIWITVYFTTISLNSFIIYTVNLWVLMHDYNSPFIRKRKKPGCASKWELRAHNLFKQRLVSLVRHGHLTFYTAVNQSKKCVVHFLDWLGFLSNVPILFWL